MPCPQFVIWAAAASLLPNTNTVAEYEFYLDGLLKYEGSATRVEICIDETTTHMLEVVAVHEHEGIQIGRKVVRNVGVYTELQPPGQTPTQTPTPTASQTPTPTATSKPENRCADLDWDGWVGYSDFGIFTSQFGQRCE